MILHIIGAGGMFTKDFYELIGSRFDVHEHSFLSRSANHPNFQSAESNLHKPRVVETLSFAALRVLYRSEMLIVHGMNDFKVLAFFFLQPWLLRKVNWVIWGGDIYGRERSGSRLRQLIREQMRRSVYRRIPLVTTLAKDDYEYASSRYGVVAQHLTVTYPVPASDPNVMSALLKPRERADHDPVVIQIGNSATETNHHIEVLDLLSHLSAENIRIFLPLNYGSADFIEYREAVAAHAKKIFSDKVDVLESKITGDEYLKRLKRVDIGIFNNDRQQAMGNISQLALSGSKIFMRNDTTMWGHFRALGCQFYPIEDLVDSNIVELLRMPESVRSHNQEVIAARHNIEVKVTQWQMVFAATSKVLHVRKQP